MDEECSSVEFVDLTESPVKSAIKKDPEKTKFSSLRIKKKKGKDFSSGSSITPVTVLN